MKASLKFREDQKPLVRAKIPLSVLGLPLLSGISAGDSKELCLHLGTFFDSGPSVRFAYRPNDSWNPLGVVLKTGIGSLGAMSAEFNLLGRGNPTFFLHFKPRIGDFSIKKTAASTIPLPSVPAVKDRDDESEEGSVEGAPIGNGGVRPGEVVCSRKKAAGFSPDFAGLIRGLVSGNEVRATSVLPLRRDALLKFRWGVRLPAELPGGDWSRPHPTAQISLRKIPILVMDKISIVHVAKQGKANGGTPGDPFATEAADVAEPWNSLRRQVETLQANNGLLRKAFDDLMSEMEAGKHAPIAGGQNSGTAEKALRGGERNGWKSPEVDRLAGKVAEGDVSEELK